MTTILVLATLIVALVVAAVALVAASVGVAHQPHWFVRLCLLGATLCVLSGVGLAIVRAYLLWRMREGDGARAAVMLRAGVLAVAGTAVFLLLLTLAFYLQLVAPPSPVR